MTFERNDELPEIEEGGEFGTKMMRTLPPSDIFLITEKFIFVGHKSTLFRTDMEGLDLKKIETGHKFEKLLSFDKQIYALSMEQITVLSPDPLEIIFSTPFQPKTDHQYISNPDRQIITDAVLVEDKLFLTSRSFLDIPIYDADKEEILWSVELNSGKIFLISSVSGKKLSNSRLLYNSSLFYLINGELKVFDSESKLILNHSLRSDNYEDDSIKLLWASKDEIILNVDFAVLISLDLKTRETKRMEIDGPFNSLFTDGYFFLGSGYGGLTAFYIKKLSGKKRILKVKISEECFEVSTLHYDSEAQKVYLFSRVRSPTFFSLKNFWVMVDKLNQISNGLNSVIEELYHEELDKLNCFQNTERVSFN